MVQRVGELNAEVVIELFMKRGADQPRSSRKEQWNKVMKAASRPGVVGPVDERAIPRGSQGDLIATGGCGEEEDGERGRGAALHQQPHSHQSCLATRKMARPFWWTLRISSVPSTSSGCPMYGCPTSPTYSMKVPGHIFGSSEEWVRPALRVIPCGWPSPSCRPSLPKPGA